MKTKTKTKIKMIVFLLMFVSSALFADTGIVIKDNVCGDKVIIETNSGWFIAAEWYGGYTLNAGDTVYGTFLSYGIQTLTTDNDQESNYWIEDFVISLGAAYEQLCK